MAFNHPIGPRILPSMHPLWKKAPPFHMHFTKARQRALVGLLAAVLFLCLAMPAAAQAVYGRVFLPDGKPLQSKSIELQNTRHGFSVRVLTDPDGRFNASITPGWYEVSYRQEAMEYEARIQSYLGRTRQDIHLRPAR